MYRVLYLVQVCVVNSDMAMHGPDCWVATQGTKRNEWSLGIACFFLAGGQVISLFASVLLYTV